MYKSIALSLVPLIMAIGVALGVEMNQDAVTQYLEAIVMIVGVTGTAVGVLVPSIKAKLKHGEKAE